MKTTLRHLFFIAVLAVSSAATGLAQSSPVVITSPAALPPGTVGGSYNYQFQASGGSPPYTWSKGNPFAVLPDGLALSSSGALFGTPTVAGEFTFPIRVVDSQGQAAANTFFLSIGEGLVIVTESLPSGVPGQPYETTLLASGGAPPYVWDTNGGSLPPGYRLNAQTGEISGVTQQEGVFQFQIIVVDSQQRTAIKNFSLSVQAGPPTIEPEPPLPTAFVGQTYAVSLSVAGAKTFFSWFVIAGALPPGLDLNIETGDITGIPTEPGIFVWTVLAQNPEGASVVRQYSIRVEGNPQQLPDLAVDLLPLNFSFASGSGPRTRGMRIRNTGGGEVPVTIAGSTKSGGNWINISPREGVVTAASPLEVLIQADPASAGPGSFFGDVSVTADLEFGALQAAGAQTLGIPASMTISSRRQFLRLSLDGLTFTAVKGGNNPPPLSFDVINDGVEPMPSTTGIVAIPSDITWLNVSPPQQTVDPGERRRVSVVVNTQSLDPGVHFGLVEVRAADAAGEVRLLTVVLNLLPPGNRPPPVVEPIGLLFTGMAGGAAPSARSFVISNLGEMPVTFTSLRFSEGDTDPFTHSPQQGQIPPNQPATIVVQPEIGALAPGVYRSVIALGFGDGTIRIVNAELIVGPAAGAALRNGAALNGCPTALNVTIASLSGGYPSYVDAPGFLRADVADDCGQPFVEGSGRTVRAESAGQTVFLEHNAGGAWEATFDLDAGGMQTIEVTAQDLPRGLVGHATIADNIQPPLAMRPSIQSGGIVHAATYIQPVAPGGIISIFGEAQSETPNPLGESATTLPLPELLAGTRVRAGGVFLPLFFSLPRQVNAGLPYDLDPDSGPLSVVVFRGSIPSDPEEVAVTAANPGLFTVDASGSGEGAFRDIDGRRISSSLSPEQNPGGRMGISPGEPVSIFVTGMGRVTPAPDSGHAASADPLSFVNSVTQLTIGGQNAQVLFTGLAPGFVSLYQVNALVPEGLPPGDAEVILTVNGVSSALGVTLSIQ